MNADEIKHKFQADMDAFVTGIMFHKGSVVGVLKRHCRSDSDYRLVLKALTGHTSSKQLNDAEWHALYKFVLPFKPNGGKWGSQHSEELTTMCNTLVLSTIDTPDQMRFV